MKRIPDGARVRFNYDGQQATGNVLGETPGGYLATPSWGGWALTIRRRDLHPQNPDALVDTEQENES